MRNLYTVYDLGNSILSVALTNFEAAGEESNVISIPKGGVAAITKDAFKSRPSPTSSGNEISKSPTPVPAQTSPPGEQIPENSRKGVAIGVGVAVPIVAIIALAGAFMLFRRRRKARDSEAGVKKWDESSTSIGRSELADDGSAGGVTELSDDQQPKGELYGNAIHEISDEQKVAGHELPAKERRYELA